MSERFVVLHGAGIKPELYTKKDAVLRQESSVASLGRLHVRVKYDYRTSDLIVHLIEGLSDLIVHLIEGLSDFIVRLIEGLSDLIVHTIDCSSSRHD